MQTVDVTGHHQIVISGEQSYMRVDDITHSSVGAELPDPARDIVVKASLINPSK